MKIAILEPYIGVVGGAQKVIAKYAKYLISKGHDVEIFTQRNTTSPYKDFEKIKINTINPTSTIFSPFAFMKKFEGYDLIIANDWPTHFASLRNKNVVWICYSPKRDFYDLKEFCYKNASLRGKIILKLKEIFFKKLDFIAAKKCKEIFPISNVVKERLNKYYNINPKNRFYCGINFDQYEKGKFSDYVLCVSRLVKPKRTENIVKSMRFVKNKKIKLYVVGSGPEENNLKEMAKNNPNILFLKNIDDKKLSELYSNCLSVIFIPKNEDWGLISLEAMASGKPVIGVNEGGIKELIENNKTGFLLDDISPEIIAEKIDFLDSNKDMAKKMGEKGRIKAREFDWKNLLSKFEKHISKHKNN